MLEIQSSLDVPYDNIGHIAVAIRERDRQPHVGILYRSGGEQIALLHLVFHFDLRRETPDFSYHWIASHIDPVEAAPFAEWLNVLWARHSEKGEIPFCIEYCGQYFDRSGNYLRNEIGDGLTCATFILAAFNDFGFPLIDPATWPRSRMSDKSWHKKILRYLEAKAPKEHVEKQRGKIGVAARFQPEEVGGAFGIFAGTPIVHKAVEPLVDSIRKAIRPSEKAEAAPK